MALDAQASGQKEKLPPTTVLGHVHLIVKDLERELAFYQQVLGFELMSTAQGEARLGAQGDLLLKLSESPGASRPLRAAGLYHFAPRVPTRADLARLLRRLVQADAELQGLVDHHTSEAIYVADPEGNGIELYWDKPHEQWPLWEEMLRLGNAPLDVQGLMAELAASNSDGRDERAREGASAGSSCLLPGGSVIGHVHLHVADLKAGDEFYLGVLGFEKTGEFPDQAHFVSAGGYHHHVAYNIWAGKGVPPAPPGSLGLQHFTIRLPEEAEVGRVLSRVEKAGKPVERSAEGPLVTDPSGNRILFETK